MKGNDCSVNSASRPPFLVVTKFVLYVYTGSGVVPRIRVLLKIINRLYVLYIGFGQYIVNILIDYNGNT